MNRTELALFGDGTDTLQPETFAPIGVRGPDKVAQRFLYALLQPLGTVPGRVTDGTEFLAMVEGFASEFDIHIAFQASLPDAIATVQSYEDADDEDDEKIGAARLESLEISGDGVTMTITIITIDNSAPSRSVDFTLEA